MKIITTNIMWASNIRYMNDASEILHAYDLVKELIDKYLKVTDSKPLKKCLTTFKEEIESYKKTFEAYAFCMCDGHDLLSQWREYGSRGTGYAVGFISKSLAVIANNNTMYELLPIIYEKDDQTKLLERIIIKVKQFLESTDGSADDLLIASELLKVGIELYVPQFNHEGFKEEKEWRFICRPRFLNMTKSHEIQYRPSGHFIVPYVELKDLIMHQRLPINSIIQGPQTNPGIAMTSINTLLWKFGYRDVSVSKSDIPVRFN